MCGAAYWDARHAGKAERESLQKLRRGQRVSVRCMVLHDTNNKSAALLLTRCGVAP
jgi:hypothetical protein